MLDVNNLGVYDYYLNDYWIKDNHWTYFVLVDGSLAGVAMVNTFPEIEERKADYTMSEFFVMYKYQGKGVGKYVAKEVFNNDIQY